MKNNTITLCLGWLLVTVTFGSPATATAQPASPAPTPGSATAGQAGIAPPTVSRSGGVEGGIVLLWPRIIPRSLTEQNHQLAGALQAHFRKLVEREWPNRPLDVRPEPERVCPQAGCQGLGLGLLLLRRENGCAVLALLNRPGITPIRIVPWAGNVLLRSETVPYREPPESQVGVADYVPCDQLTKPLTEQEARIRTALLELAASPASGEATPARP